MGINYAALALIGGALFAPTDASATSVDLGTVIATFDESSFNAIGISQLSGIGRITFMPGPSVFTEGGASSADFSARIDFAPKPGITVTGFNLSGFGSASAGPGAAATLTGTLGDVTINGDTSTSWQSYAALGAAADMTVAGTLTAQGGTFTTFEQVGTHIEQHVEQVGTTQGVIGQGFVVIGQHEEFTFITVEDGFDVTIDEDGNVIITPRYIEVQIPFLVDDYGWVDIFGPIPVYGIVDVEIPDFGDVLHNSSASIALDSFSIEVVATPLLPAQVMLGTGLGLLALISVRRRVPPQT